MALAVVALRPACNAYGDAKVEARVRIPGTLLRAAVPRNLLGGWGLLLAAPSRPNLRFVRKCTNLKNWKASNTERSGGTPRVRLDSVQPTRLALLTYEQDSRSIFDPALSDYTNGRKVKE